MTEQEKIINPIPELENPKTEPLKNWKWFVGGLLLAVVGYKLIGMK